MENRNDVHQMVTPDIEIEIKLKEPDSFAAIFAAEDDEEEVDEDEC